MNLHNTSYIKTKLLTTTALSILTILVPLTVAKAQSTISPNADWDNVQIVAGQAVVLDTGIGTTTINQTSNKQLTTKRNSPSLTGITKL